MSDFRFHDWTNEEYHADKSAVSLTGLQTFRRSSAYYNALNTGAIEKPAHSPALEFGIWAHTATLEPHIWARDFVKAIKVDRRTTEGKQRFAAFAELHRGKAIVPIEDFEEIERIVDAVRENPLGRAALAAPGGVEESYSWIDEFSGIRLKSRPDKTLADSNILVDLKTCEDCSPAGFQAACRRHSYEMTAAFRIEGHLQRLAFENRPPAIPRYVFLAVSKSTYDVACYEIDQLAIEHGSKRIAETLVNLARCRATGDWRNAWSTQVMTLCYPAWFFSDSNNWEV